MYEQGLIDNFKVCLADKGELCYDFVNEGFVIDFKPTPAQLFALRSTFKPLDMRTLFSVEERKNSDPFQLIQKQILHYVEVYGLNMPGLFNLEFEGGKVVTLAYVRGVSQAELEILIQGLLYANAPVKDVTAIKSLVQHFKVDYDLNVVANNELRVSLFDVYKDRFESGDDAVRYMCLIATQNSMLIKSKKVIEAIKLQKFDPKFFENHLVPLAQVFNRHKPLILAAKNKQTRTVINKIARMSKNLHKPVFEGINKRFIAEALSGRLDDFSVLDAMSLRDKFKFLNLLEYKFEQNGTDAFLIRNGTVHVENGRKIYDRDSIVFVQKKVLDSIQNDLAFLAKKSILLDENVDYGLPISRKQTLGNLPYGTTVTVGDEISAGMYWENDWGARDLDLSAIDIIGQRTGWGQYSGYDRHNPITFSGDITDATNGAMEFMTSGPNASTYGLFVNIFSGDESDTQMEIVVGNKASSKKSTYRSGDQRWIDKPVLREKITLNERGSIIGFVRAGKYVAYAPAVGGSRISGGPKSEALLARGDAEFWTVQKLLDVLGISYYTKKEAGKQYDYDLSYEGFSYDKLESLLIA